MPNLSELQNFYKAQKVRNPWAVARAIVDQKGGEVNPLWEEETKEADTEEKKRSLMGKIVAGLEQNPWNKSMDDPIEFFESLLKGTVNGKDFSYDAKGHQEAIDYATELMENKESVNFDWDHYEKSIQKISPGAMGALAGWWLGGTIRDDYQRQSAPTAAQQREFERQIRQAMRRKGRMTKESAMEKMQSFFQKDENDTYVRKTPVKNAVKADAVSLEKVMSLPPFAGAKFDPAVHRWVKPENVGQTYQARGGKKRIRGTGTGAHQRSVSGHGKGRIRGEGAERKYKGESDLAAQRRKEGFTHGKQTGKQKG